MTQLLGSPLTPSNCDLRDFAFMPLDVVRLRDSDIAALSSGEEFRSAVLLWCASWHQIPAASLPNDDKVLAQLAGFGRVVAEWKAVKEGALRGWVLCSDNRLYHPVIAEKANDAWVAKLTQRWKTECARIKKHNQRCGTDLTFPTLEEFMSPDCPQGQVAYVPRDVDSLSRGTGLDTSDKPLVANGKKDAPKQGDPKITHCPIDETGTNKNVPRDKQECPDGQTRMSRDCPSGNGIQGTGIGTETGIVINKEREAGKPPIVDNSTPAGTICRDLRALGVEGVNPHNPNLLRLIKAGVTADEFAETAREPKARGKGFAWLLAAVEGRRNDASAKGEVAAKYEAPWFLSASGIQSKGDELGIKQKDGEMFPYFRKRVFEAAGVTDEVIRKAKIDAGEKV